MAELTSALNKRTRIVSSLGEAKILAVEGKSAYEVALAEGFTGTVEEWLESLVGPPGNPGDDGTSPTVAVEETETGHRVSVTDAAGTHSFDVPDGEGRISFVSVHIDTETGELIVDKTPESKLDFSLNDDGYLEVTL